MSRAHPGTHSTSAVSLTLIAALLICGCGDQSAPTADVLTAAVERGPLSFTVEVGPAQVRVGDTITVSLRVETPTGYDVRFPTADDFGDLQARSDEDQAPRPGPTGIVWRRAFTVEPLVSGPLEIPPLVVAYRPPATDGDDTFENELVTNTLTLEVGSALTDEDQPAQPRDITGALLPPKPPWPLWLWAVVIASSLAALASIVVAIHLIRRRLSRPPPPILPEVWALRVLAELERENWFDRHGPREYYYRLTGVVREYIERKFALAAPEMTTEEFLTMLARDRHSLPYDSERLRAFLEACDYVKYAALHPGREDADGVLATARAFVNATAASAGGSAA